ncbi:hypothetical protein [Serratia marcescens]|uniref:hypothetical protein n=1 Tax=Serratia marcescens TaxID=615 RepID=UPI0005357D17|nr:hypothetical protein [Serratia marcescens]
MDSPYLIAITIYITAYLPVMTLAMFMDGRGECRLIGWKDWAGISVILLVFLLIGATIKKYLLGH